jgi:hypothetical protein
MRGLVIMAILTAGSTCLFAQNAPIKMGLWEKTMESPNGDGAPATIKSKSCITPEAWQQMIASLQKPHDGCTMNTVKTGNGYSFNGTCTMQGGTLMTISGTETIPNSEQIVAESHSSITKNGKTRKIDIHSTSRFLSSSCGSIKPDEPEVE